MNETTGRTPRGGARAKVIAAALAVFVLGCVTGAALDSAYRLRASGHRRSTQHGQQGRGDFFKSLQNNLDLDERQTEQIRSIIDETREGYRQLQTEVSPRYDALRRDGRARIRALLTPEQQQKFDQMTAERDARRQSEERRDGEERGRP
jgi:Spy/CpxP family protein refolding chaperone